MKYLLYAFAGLFFMEGVASCQHSTRDAKDKFDFGILTYYTTACNGTCPVITMELTSSNQVQLIRTIYKKKGVVDTVNSGGFKGSLKENDYNKVVELLGKINWDSISFPDVQCCDRPVVSIILSYNNTDKRFRSMNPPAEARELINFLNDFLSHVSLPRYDKPMDFTAYELPPPMN